MHRADLILDASALFDFAQEMSPLSRLYLCRQDYCTPVMTVISQSFGFQSWFRVPPKQLEEEKEQRVEQRQQQRQQLFNQDDSSSSSDTST